MINYNYNYNLTFSTGLDKSSSDVAAEGALLNEMLEIVAKRAALRPSDAGTSHESNTSDALDSDVSERNLTLNPHTTRRNLINWAHVIARVAISYICILYFAHTRKQ